MQLRLIPKNNKARDKLAEAKTDVFDVLNFAPRVSCKGNKAAYLLINPKQGALRWVAVNDDELFDYEKLNEPKIHLEDFEKTDFEGDYDL